MKRALKIAGIGLGVVAALLVLALVAVALFVDLDGIVNAQLAKRKPEIEAQLGRKVEVGKVSTRLFPTLAVRLESVSVAAQNPEEPALVAVGPVKVDVALWDAVRSRGEQINVNEVVISNLRVHLVRAADGTLSYEDILERLSSGEEEPTEPEEPEEASSGLGGFRLDELRVENAAVTLVDHATGTGVPATSEIRKLDVRVRDVRAGANVRAEIRAALFAEEPNFELQASYGPLESESAAPGAVKLRMDKVDLSKLSPYVPKSAGVGIESAIASAEWDVGALTETAPVPVKGFLSVEQLQLEGGERFELRVDTDLTADLKGPGVDIAALNMKVGSVSLSASGALQDLSSAPKFRDFKVKSDTLSPNALLGYYPPLRESLPKGSRFDGAAKLDVTATGDAQKQHVVAALDLAPLDVFYPGMLVKPAGVPMGLQLTGDLTAQDVLLERLQLALGDLQLLVKGSVKGYDGDATVYDLTASAPPFSFDRLVKLLPSVREGLDAQRANASGTGKLAGHFRGTMQNLDAGLDFGLQGMKLDVPGTKVDGDVRLVASAKGDPDKTLRAQLDFDANEAVIQVKDVMDKGLRTPLKLAVALQRTPDRLDVETFDLKLAELGLQVQGGIDYPKNTVDVRVRMDRLDLEKFARTVTAIPASFVKGGHLAMKVNVTGDPDRMETLKLAMTDVDVKLGKSDLRGEVLLQNPSKPDLKMTMKSRMLDLDELFPSDDSGEAASGETASGDSEKSEPAKDDPELREYRMHAALDADTVIYEGAELTKFRGVVRLEDGRLVLDDASFNAYGGAISAKGTEAEIWRGKMPFKANITASGVELGRVLADQTRYGNVLQGKTDLQLQLSGRGYDTADLEQFLSGGIELAMREGRFNKGSVTDGVVSRLDGLEKIPGVSLQPLKGENAIRDLVAKLEVKDGKLTLAKPVTFTVDQAKATLEGAVGIAGSLHLDGTFFLPAAVLGKATGGRCTSDKELPIPLSIVGSVDGPEYQPRVAEALKPVVEKCVANAAANAAANALEQKLGVKVPGGVPTSVDDAKAKAQAEADRLREEAEAKARADAERLRKEAEAKARAEAEKRLAEQRRKAEEAAKKKAQDALKGFGR